MTSEFRHQNNMYSTEMDINLWYLQIIIFYSVTKINWF